MAGTVTRKIVSLDSLLNDTDNARHEPTTGQQEIYEIMLSQYGSKIYALAKSIAEHGLSKIDSILVTPSMEKKGKYIVMEGNRRIVAAKLLNNPAYANGTKWEKKFELLAEKYEGNIPQRIEVVVETDEQEALRLIEIRHDGEQQGAGLIPWNPQQKARADIRKSGKAKRYHESVELLDYAIKHSLLGEKTSEKLLDKKFPITTLERMLKDKYLRKQIGINHTNSGWELTKKPTESHKGISRILKDLAGGLSVSKVKNKDLIKDYLSKLGKDLPDPKSELTTPIPTKTLTNTAAIKKKRAIVDPRKRKFLIDEPIPVSDKNTVKIYIELRDHLNLTSTPNAAACLLRVLVDQSLDHFIKAKHIQVTGNQRDNRFSLKDRMKAVGEYLKAQQILDRPQSKAILEACNKNSGIVDPDNLQLRLHSQYNLSTQSDLTHMWDSVYGILLKAIWQNI